MSKRSREHERIARLTQASLLWSRVMTLYGEGGLDASLSQRVRDLVGVGMDETYPSVLDLEVLQALHVDLGAAVAATNQHARTEFRRRAEELLARVSDVDEEGAAVAELFAEYRALQDLVEESEDLARTESGRLDELRDQFEAAAPTLASKPGGREALTTQMLAQALGRTPSAAEGLLLTSEVLVRSAASSDLRVDALKLAVGVHRLPAVLALALLREVKELVDVTGVGPEVLEVMRALLTDEPRAGLEEVLEAAQALEDS